MNMEEGGYSARLAQVEDEQYAFLRLPDRHPLMSLIRDGWGVAGFPEGQICQYGLVFGSTEFVDGHWWLGYPVPNDHPPALAMKTLIDFAGRLERAVRDRRPAATQKET